jgi:mannose-6-phosphate isomerase-like protein (cupin superfamily)
MNSQIFTLEPTTTPTNSKTILSKNGFTCSLLMLAPGDETPRPNADQVEEHVLYIVEGSATVRFEDLNTILNEDEAMLIPRGKQHVIAADSGAWAKLLRLDVPPRQVVVPQIISFDR